MYRYLSSESVRCIAIEPFRRLHTKELVQKWLKGRFAWQRQCSQPVAGAHGCQYRQDRSRCLLDGDDDDNDATDRKRHVDQCQCSLHHGRCRCHLGISFIATAGSLTD